MAKNRAKAAGKVADAATESARMRMLRIDGSQNGATLRTRIVRDKTKYNRNIKHKKSLADARDFAFLNTYFRLNCLRQSSNSLSLSL
jgi:hypothetical protein